MIEKLESPQIWDGVNGRQRGKDDFTVPTPHPHVTHMRTSCRFHLLTFPSKQVTNSCTSSFLLNTANLDDTINVISIN